VGLRTFREETETEVHPSLPLPLLLGPVGSSLVSEDVFELSQMIFTSGVI
jgi:hypothetical protein